MNLGALGKRRHGLAFFAAKNTKNVHASPPLKTPLVSINPLQNETRLLNALHRSVLALDARLDECGVREDQDARAADEPEKGRDRGRDPEDRDADDQEDHVEVFRFDRGRAELDRFRDEAVDPDVALREDVFRVSIEWRQEAQASYRPISTHADEEGDRDEEKRVREERVDGEEEKHWARQ